MRVTAIGWRAHAALLANRGRVQVLAPLSNSFYGESAGELLWVGPPGTPLHARTVIASDPPSPTAGMPLDVTLAGIASWRPPDLSGPLTGDADAARALQAVFVALGKPRGLGVLLTGGMGEDPVTARARPHARKLAEACAASDAPAFAEAARPLLGLGSGLTPSGDDFVGGALFARRLMAVGDATAWNAAVARIVADAAVLTHPISARLLGDLAAGEGWAPLHDLARGLARGEVDAAIGAARHLTALGHSSGWDLLTGLLMGLLGSADLLTARTCTCA